MYPIDAKTEVFDEVEILGIPALYTVCRIDPATIPSGMYAYEMEMSESDWVCPKLLAAHVEENLFGTVLTAVPIELPPSGVICLKPGDLTHGRDAERLTARGFEHKYLSPKFVRKSERRVADSVCR